MKLPFGLRSAEVRAWISNYTRFWIIGYWSSARGPSKLFIDMYNLNVFSPGSFHIQYPNLSIIRPPGEDVDGTDGTGSKVP